MHGPEAPRPEPEKRLPEEASAFPEMGGLITTRRLPDGWSREAHAEAGNRLLRGRKFQAVPFSPPLSAGPQLPGLSGNGRGNRASGRTGHQEEPGPTGSSGAVRRSHGSPGNSGTAASNNDVPVRESSPAAGNPASSAALPEVPAETRRSRRSPRFCSSRRFRWSRRLRCSCRPEGELRKGGATAGFGGKGAAPAAGGRTGPPRKKRRRTERAYSVRFFR